MNGDLDEAVGVFCEQECHDGEPAVAVRATPPPLPTSTQTPPPPEDHWSWRLAVAESLAAQMDPERFGVRGIWLYGSTKNATAHMDSDVDLLVHFDGTDEQRAELLAWLEGWGEALAEMYWLRTGHRAEQLLDARLVSTEDIERRRGPAAKIDAVTDAAHPLPMGTRAS